MNPVSKDPIIGSSINEKKKKTRIFFSNKCIYLNILFCFDYIYVFFKIIIKMDEL